MIVMQLKCNRKILVVYEMNRLSEKNRGASRVALCF